MSTAREPVTVAVRLDPVLFGRLERVDPDLRYCHESLAAGLSRLVNELGLPIKPAVHVEPGEAAGTEPGGEATVGVRLSDSPSPSISRVTSRTWYWACAAGLPFGTTTGLADALGGLADAQDAHSIGRTLTAIVTEAARADAVLLLTPPVVTRWAANARLPAVWEPGTILRELISLGLSPGDGGELAEAIAGSGGPQLEMDTAGLEALIASRATSPWEICLNHGSLHHLTSNTLIDPNWFRQLHMLLASDKGLLLPRITLKEDVSPTPGQVSFRLFGVTSPIVLDINSSAVMPGQGTEQEHGTSEASESPVKLVASALYLLALDRSGALITTTTMAEKLEHLSQSYPRLAELISATGIETASRLCRSLASEGVNVANMLPILQATLDVRERSNFTLSDEELLRQVRARLSRMITWSAADGADHLTAWRVPEALENVQSESEVDKLLILAHRAASETTPGQVVVTTRQARMAVRAAVAAGYPDLPVLSDDELTGAPLVTVSQDP